MITSKPQEQSGTTPELFPRVLYLIDRLHSTTGGAEGALQKVCQFLPTLGFRCSVVTFWAGKGVIEEFPCPVRVLPLTRMYDWNALRCAIALNRQLRTEQVQIVHTFFPASDLWGGVVARLSRCPILISSRRDMGIARLRKHHLAYKLLDCLFDQVHAVSDQVREFCLAQDGLSPDRVVTVNNGIDLEAIEAALPCDRTVLQGDNGHDAPVVITVANTRHVKGIDVLVKAALVVREQVPDVQFVIVGSALQEPAYDAGIRKDIRQLGLERNVRFIGTRTDVASLLKPSDVFCLPSRSEGMSNALLEAMACSLPCVATAVGGNLEVVVSGQTGFLVPNQDYEALAARIVILLRDRNLAQSMGQEGRRIIESKFTVQHMAERLASLYRELLLQRGLLRPSPASETAGAVPDPKGKNICGINAVSSL